MQKFKVGATFEYMGVDYEIVEIDATDVSIRRLGSSSSQRARMPILHKTSARTPPSGTNGHGRTVPFWRPGV